MIEQTLQSVLSILLYVIMIGVIIHWFLIAVIPLTVTFLLLYVIFRVGLREMKRLQNISVSPLLSHISATVQGLHSVHAYNMEESFTNKWVLSSINMISILLVISKTFSNTLETKNSTKNFIHYFQIQWFARSQHCDDDFVLLLFEMDKPSSWSYHNGYYLLYIFICYTSSRANKTWICWSWHCVRLPGQ